MASRNLKNLAIPECLCREPSDFTVPNVAGSATQAFGDDETCCFILDSGSERRQEPNDFS